MKKIIYIIDIILVIVIISIFVYTKTTDTKMIKTNVDIKLLTKKKFKKLAVITSDAKVDLKKVDTSSTNNDNTSVTSNISNSSNTSTDDKTSSNVVTNTSSTDSNNSTNSGTDSGVSGAPIDTNTNSNTSTTDTTTTPAVDYLESVTGNLSSYGPDCEGCSGGLASGKSFFVDGNNAFYHDDTYGNVRVLAGSKTYKFGTIIRVKGSVIGDFNAIVLDRGGVGVGHRYMFDLLFPSEALGCASSYGVTFEVLRKGW